MPPKRPLIHPLGIGGQFDQNIDFIRKNSMGVPQKLTIDLAVARADTKYDITGNFFYVVESVNDNDYIEVRFNERQQPQHIIQKMMGFRTPFYSFYLSHPAQAAGIITVVYGTLSTEFLDIIDNRSPTSLDLDEIRRQLEGDAAEESYGAVNINAAATNIRPANANRIGIFVQNMLGNTGILYLGCSNAVTAANHFVGLNPGDWWSTSVFKGAVWGIQTVANDDAAYIEV